MPLFSCFRPKALKYAADTEDTLSPCSTNSQKGHATANSKTPASDLLASAVPSSVTLEDSGPTTSLRIPTTSSTIVEEEEMPAPSTSFGAAEGVSGHCNIFVSTPRKQDQEQTSTSAPTSTHNVNNAATSRTPSQRSSPRDADREGSLLRKLSSKLLDNEKSEQEEQLPQQRASPSQQKPIGRGSVPSLVSAHHERVMLTASGRRRSVLSPESVPTTPLSERSLSRLLTLSAGTTTATSNLAPAPIATPVASAVAAVAKGAPARRHRPPSRAAASASAAPKLQGFGELMQALAASADRYGPSSAGPLPSAGASPRRPSTLLLGGAGGSLNGVSALSSPRRPSAFFSPSHQMSLVADDLAQPQTPPRTPRGMVTASGSIYKVPSPRDSASDASLALRGKAGSSTGGGRRLSSQQRSVPQPLSGSQSPSTSGTIPNAPYNFMRVCRAAMNVHGQLSTSPTVSSYGPGSGPLAAAAAAAGLAAAGGASTSAAEQKRQMFRRGNTVL